MTLFAFEPPNKHLKDFDDLQDFHFLLSMHCNDPQYLSWYQTRFSRRDTRTLILDNSFNETFKADDAKSLIHFSGMVQADITVVPDDPQWDTSMIADSFMEMCDYLPSNKCLTVVNSHIMKQQLQRIGATRFALSYHIRLPHYKQGGLPDDFTWASNCHFLGLCNIDEIIQLRPPTCDTSMPIKLGIMHCTLDTWIEEGCPHIHTKDILNSFFSKKMSQEQIDLSRNNILRLKELCNSKEKYNAKERAFS